MKYLGKILLWTYFIPFLLLFYKRKYYWDGKADIRVTVVQSQTDWLLAKACLRTSQPILGGAVGGILLNNNKKKKLLFQRSQGSVQGDKSTTGVHNSLKEKEKKSCCWGGVSFDRKKKRGKKIEDVEWRGGGGRCRFFSQFWKWQLRMTLSPKWYHFASRYILVQQKKIWMFVISLFLGFFLYFSPSSSLFYYSFLLFSFFLNYCTFLNFHYFQFSCDFEFHSFFSNFIFRDSVNILSSFHYFYSLSIMFFFISFFYSCYFFQYFLIIFLLHLDSFILLSFIIFHLLVPFHFFFLFVMIFIFTFHKISSFSPSFSFKNYIFSLFH